MTLTSEITNIVKGHSETMQKGNDRIINVRRTRNGISAIMPNRIRTQGNINRTVRSDWQMLKRFAEHHGFIVTSTTGDRHAPNSRHYRGLAIDVRTKGRRSEDVENFMRLARDSGIKVLDERTNVFNSPNWTNEHLHLELNDNHTFNFSLGGDLGSILGAKLGQSIIPIPGVGGAIGGYLGGLLGNKVSGLFGKRRPAQAPVREMRPEPMITTGNAELYATGGQIENTPNVTLLQNATSIPSIDQDPEEYKLYNYNSKEDLLELGYTEKQILDFNPQFNSIHSLPIGSVIKLPVNAIDYSDLNKDVKLNKYLNYKSSDIYAVLNREDKELNFYNGKQEELLSIPASLSKFRSEELEINKELDDGDVINNMVTVKKLYKGTPYETSFFLDDEEYDFAGKSESAPSVKVLLSDGQYLALTPEYHSIIEPFLENDIDIHIEGKNKGNVSAYNLINGSIERANKRKKILDGKLINDIQSDDIFDLRGMASLYANKSKLMNDNRVSSDNYDQQINKVAQEVSDPIWKENKKFNNLDLSKFDISNKNANLTSSSIAFDLDLDNDREDTKNTFLLSALSDLT